MKHFAKRFLKFAVGIALLPWTLASWVHLPGALFPLTAESRALVWLLLGILLYVVFEVTFSRPMRTYVFGHELTHALASMAMGGKVLSFNVSKKGGSVSLSKTNFFVALAPYCAPIYALALLAGYFLARIWIPQEKIQVAFLILLGASLAFHASLTFYAMKQDQPDITETGIVFSIVFILCVNAWVLLGVAKIVFWNAVAFRAFVRETWITHAVLWGWIGTYAVAGWRWVLLHWQRSEAS